VAQGTGRKVTEKIHFQLKERNMSLQELSKTWDLVIIGGGITGAGILREATRMGVKSILIEQKDFAWGTSSRSSKLVHGGLRYLKEGQFRMTKIAVEEREYLLQDAPGLVESLGFLLPVYEDQKPGRRTLKLGLSIYDIMAREKQHQYYEADEFVKRVPLVNRNGLVGGFYYMDAQVDDSRLVLRLIYESVAAGAKALNYATVTRVERNSEGQVTGVRVADTETRETKYLEAPAVINATGCWAERLHPSPEPQRHLRPLRGSHLVFPAEALPLSEGFGFFHPQDKRSVFMIPWEGAVLVGTTDLDHTENLSREPTITEAEVSYLLEGIHTIFPSLDISLNDCIAAFAGVRPVLSEGNREPSEESREHVIWVDKGLVTVTGGKLTTFRRLAWDALKAAKSFLPPMELPDRKGSIFSPVPETYENDFGLDGQLWRRLYGRYGQDAVRIVESAQAEDLSIIPGTHTLWAELPFVAENENIRHLDDLLLRRVRIGLLTPGGGKTHLKRIRKLCRNALPWSRRRWRQEIKAYRAHWFGAHGLPVRQAKLQAEKKFVLFRKIVALFKRLSNHPLRSRAQR
jgi:glycerol-3-phosphate dehydrogenase